jgi:NADH:ubiquinone oxidoreductase subunit F (NADH-binding)/(2Fe-2S) ferredoxin/NAD-dependent dihydropyrimidine dehydrogenase PreA subunit
MAKSDDTKAQQSNKAAETQYRMDLMLCAGTACVSNGVFKIQETLERELEKHNLEKEIQVVMTGCNGFCAQGPVMVVMPDGIFYQFLKEEDIPHLVEEHFLKGRPVKKLMFIPPAEELPVPKVDDIDFFKKQKLIALKNRGLIDPEKIDEYIARDGYRAASKALTSMSPEEIIDEIKKSGLRGRGGAGFSTGRKWESAYKAKSKVKYIICNADEGDPGAYMDRSIIESDPHSVLEGMIIGAYAIQSHHGYIYIRNEYPLALKRLIIAIEQAEEYGLLGKDILGTGFDFDITVFRGAGAFVCGESSALRRSIEGKSPEPTFKHIHATEKGLWEKPTVLNNVETFANIPVIINRSHEWFSGIGTENSKGTKVFSLVGKVRNTGLVEVSMGITLREIVYDIGGGIEGGKRAKAVQTGGPSGGCIPERLFDSPVDFDRLLELGSMMGSGGLIVMDEDTCMVDVARYFLDFLKDESCGKCTSCREGTQEMYEMVTDICEGRGKEEYMKTLEELGETVKIASLCGLGTSAPNPVLSTLRYFKDEYEAHIKEKKCPARVCKSLIRYHIDEEKCTGCTLCAKNCPQEVISGERKELHKIDESNCIKCGICLDLCKVEAVVVE